MNVEVSHPEFCGELTTLMGMPPRINHRGAVGISWVNTSHKKRPGFSCIYSFL
jgi:hypothetical protein